MKKFEAELSWKIDNASNVRAVNQPWVCGPVPHVRSNQRLGKASKWMVNDLITTDRAWHSKLIRDRFEWKYATSILAMELPNEETEDFLYWKDNPSGRFTSRQTMVIWQSWEMRIIIKMMILSF